MRGIRTALATIASALVLVSCSGEAGQVTGEETGAQQTPAPATTASAPTPAPPAATGVEQQPAPVGGTQQQAPANPGGSSSTAPTPTPAPDYDYPSATPGGPDVPSVPGPGY